MASFQSLPFLHDAQVFSKGERKMNFFYAVLIGLLILVNAANAHSDDQCKECSELSSISSRLERLSPVSKKERNEGELLVMDAVGIFANQIESNSTNNKSGALSERAFDLLMEIGSSGTVFDLESSLASLTAEQIHKNEDLKKRYKSFIQAKAPQDRLNLCKMSSFKARIEEQLCRISKSSNSSKPCTSEFDFSKCINSK